MKESFLCETHESSGTRQDKYWQSQEDMYREEEWSEISDQSVMSIKW